MGKAKKGCLNPQCAASLHPECIVEKKKRVKLSFKKADEFCPRCGQKLEYVCKDCHTLLLDDSVEYCVRCAARHQEKAEQTQEIALNALKTAAGVAMTALVPVAKNGGKKAAQLGVTIAKTALKK